MKTSSLSAGRHRANQHAFTLTDLVVVIATFTILSGILFSAGATTRSKPSLLECKNNLRQVGTAIDQYAQDHTASLPGPLWSGVWPGYRQSGDPQAPTTWSLPYHLTQYLGLPAPDATYREAAVLKCPASSLEINTGTPAQIFSSPLYYISCTSITNRTGTAPVVANFPFGRPSAPFAAPMKTTDIKRPSEQWAIVDADRRIVPSGATYYSFLPADPVHNNRPGGIRTSNGAGNRNYLYFDGTVRSAVATGLQ